MYNKISPVEAKAHLDQGNCILLDVRGPQEYAQARIPGAVLHPLAQLPLITQSINKNTKILVYCHSGGRSAVAAKALDRMGYQEIYDIGGIINWPYEIQR